MFDRGVAEVAVWRRVTSRDRIWLGALASGGVGVTHALAFLLAAPDPHDRRVLLESTGHGPWPVLSAVLLGLLLAGLAGLALRAGTGGSGVTAAPSTRRIFSRLALLQAGAFVALEAAERVAVGVDLAHVLHPVVWIGVLVQVVVAAIAAVVLVAVGKVLRMIRRSTAVTPAARAAAPSPAGRDDHAPTLAPAAGGPTLRAPPRAA